MAVVEDVHGKVSGAEFMDYVAPRQVIKIGAGGSVVLSYISSCRRETISGIGTVIVGDAESAVHLADVKAEKVPCDSGHTQLTDRQVNETAATVVRSMGAQASGVSPERLTIYGVSPVIEPREPGTLTIERIDKGVERHTFQITPSALVRGRFYDLAKANRALTPGATYMATLGKHKAIFMVDARATPGATAVIGRLVRLD